jgi:hypothetical protein
MQTVLIRVKQGKGKKDRGSVIGATTRRAILAYRRTLADRDGPIFRARAGIRLTGDWLMLMFRRLSNEQADRDPRHSSRPPEDLCYSVPPEWDGCLIPAKPGDWTSLEMVQHYAQMEDFDLLQAHKLHSPVDNLK